ncbi:hypothetical protein [Vibrio coralliilyticus]|uniref:hypothetical protein n=1 Tax=Vibrio coralliilyticus TaxID=190893 RepID=UPI0006CDF17A|nr:hypothetical protein [Vibrio coralliilyticus]ANW24198.1 hypothetical protein BA953_08190 [Vibrio coralliilyticus]AXN32116.1 hypothetical protein DVV14_12930 [Vibrio coralliilyticus]KPH26363.1 hypothetical protein ADU60_14310 [Vibrio coralliilyticus]
MFLLFLFIFNVFSLIILKLNVLDWESITPALIFTAFTLILAARTFFDRYLVVAFNPIRMFLIIFSLQVTLGAWGFSQGWVIVEKDLLDYQKWDYFSENVAILLAMMSIVFYVDTKFTSQYISYSRYLRESPGKIQLQKNKFLPLFVLSIFFIFDLDLSLLGAEGDLAILPKTLVALSICILIQNLSLPLRVLIYALIVVFFAMFSIDEKREAIYLLFPIIWLESILRAHVINFRIVRYLILIFCLVFVLIIMMSIARGYGGYGEFDSLVNTIPYILKYIHSDIFVSAVLNNVEASYTFFHTLNSFELINDNFSRLAGGLTIIKPLFIIFPRDAFPLKPDSILELYTRINDPSGRELGVSWLISIFGELYWNFHILSFGVLYVVFYIFGRYFISTVAKVSSSKSISNFIFPMYVYICFLTLVRGSGFDQFFVYIIIGGTFYILLTKLFTLTRS